MNSHKIFRLCPVSSNYTLNFVSKLHICHILKISNQRAQAIKFESGVSSFSYTIFQRKFSLKSMTAVSRNSSVYSYRPKFTSLCSPYVSPPKYRLKHASPITATCCLGPNILFKQWVKHLIEHQFG